MQTGGPVLAAETWVDNLFIWGFVTIFCSWDPPSSFGLLFFKRLGAKHEARPACPVGRQIRPFRRRDLPKRGCKESTGTELAFFSKT